MTSKLKLKKLAESIVLSQGNIFIKELLRKNKIKIGVTKKEFLENMFSAIDSEQLTLEIIEKWLDEVEGWGNQHIYFYRVPDDVTKLPIWTDEKKLEIKIKSIDKLKNYWSNQSTFLFPNKMALTGIYFKDGEFKAVWHQASASLIRTPEKDEKRKIETDNYEFRAYRERADRSVMRFILKPEQKIAAYFIPLPWEPISHNDALAKINETLSPVFNISSLTPFSISSAIRELDQLQINQTKDAEQIETQMARMTSQGAYIEFAGNTNQVNPWEIRDIRNVRLALNPNNFSGSKAIFYFNLTNPSEELENLKVQLYGDQNRIRLLVQTRVSQVWGILDLISKHCDNE